MKKKVVLFAVLAACLLAGAPSAGAAAKLESHCVVQITGKKASGEFETAPPRCFARFADAMANTGVPGAKSLRMGASSAQVQAVNGASTSSFLIGIHYDGAYETGSSMSVVGDNCSGGWLNTDSSWSNRISSTANGCYRVRHFDGAWLTGSYNDTIGTGGNLWMDNATESIQYLGS